MHVGKAHLGAVDSPGGDPTNLGFDVNVAGHGAGGPGSFYGKHRFMATRGKMDFDNHQIWGCAWVRKIPRQRNIFV